MLFSNCHFQSVLDSFSVGKILWSLPLPNDFVNMKGYGVYLRRIIIRTNHGLFVLVFDLDARIHPVWWSSKDEEYEELLKKAIGLVHGTEVRQQRRNAFTVHKFDRRFSLFSL